MSRKRPQSWLIDPKQIEKWLTKAERQLMAEDYEGALKTARRVLRYIPKDSEMAGDVYHYISLAHLMRQEFEAAYDTLCSVLKTQPQSAEAWYNRGLCCRYLMRTGQSVRDLERAVALAEKETLREMYKEELAFSREMVAHELKLRGPEFTLEQLIEQQELYQQALRAMEQEQWGESEALFRRVIQMGDCLPQPWGNLAGTLIMQQRYDEAEDALHRALEMDPDYELARRNLAALPRIRRDGPVGVRLQGPFDGADINSSLTFVLEDE